MSRRWLKRFLIAALIVALMPLAYDRMLGRLGVDSVDLIVIFIVIDADSGTPIKNAHIEILSETKLKQIATLNTNDDGVASKLFPDILSASRESGLGLTFTRTVNQPIEMYRVEADGYLKPDWTEFDRQIPVQWTEPGGAIAVVAVTLHRD